MSSIRPATAYHQLQFSKPLHQPLLILRMRPTPTRPGARSAHFGRGCPSDSCAWLLSKRAEFWLTTRPGPDRRTPCHVLRIMDG